MSFRRVSASLAALNFRCPYLLSSSDAEVPNSVGDFMMRNELNLNASDAYLNIVSDEGTGAGLSERLIQLY